MDSKWTEEQIFIDDNAKNRVYGACYVIKKSNVKVKTKKNRMFAFALLIMFAGIVYFIANISTNVVNAQNVENQENACIQAQNYYAVSLSNFTDVTSSQKIAQESKVLGGAGYVLTDEGNNYVLVSMYKTIEQAQSVQAKLINSNYQNAKIVQINCKQTDYSQSVKNKNINITNFASVLAIFYNAINLYLDLIYKYDSSLLSYSDCKMQILELYNKAEDNYASVFNNGITQDEKLTNLSTSVKNVLGILKTNSDVFTKQDYFSSDLKYSCLQIAFIRSKL